MTAKDAVITRRAFIAASGAALTATAIPFFPLQASRSHG
jgi:hypothetical protein